MFTRVVSIFHAISPTVSEGSDPPFARCSDHVEDEAYERDLLYVSLQKGVLATSAAACYRAS